MTPHSTTFALFDTLTAQVKQLTPAEAHALLALYHPTVADTLTLALQRRATTTAAAAALRLTSSTLLLAIPTSLTHASPSDLHQEAD